MTRDRTTTADGRGLALRYRPRRFAEMTGQRHVVAVLSRALRDGRVPQQLLFSGGSGLGKTTVARVCAAALLCETPLADRPDGDACGQCESCLDITTPGRTHPDVIELDAASNGGKDEVRAIADRAVLAPLRADRKIYIVDEAHGLSGPGGQAFLKLLEEPPAHVVFMLCTTDPQKMLKTNRGRCTEFELLRPSDAELVANLRRVAAGEGWRLSDRVAAAVIAATDPDLGVRGSVMTLEKLAPALDAGAEPDDALLAELLGVPPAADMGRLCAALTAGDQQAAFAALDALRSRVPDTQIRAGLLDWARRSFQAAARREPGAETVELAAWRYETLVSAPAGEAWTDVAVSKVAAPRLDPSPEVLAGLLAEAEARISELSVLLAEARAAAASTPVPTGPPSRDQAPARPPGRQPAGLRAGAPAGRDGQRPAPTDADLAARFAAEVTARSRRAGAMLRSCGVTAEPGRIVITHSSAMAGPLDSERDAFNDAAAALRVAVFFASR